MTVTHGVSTSNGDANSAPSLSITNPPSFNAWESSGNIPTAGPPATGAEDQESVLSSWFQPDSDLPAAVIAVGASGQGHSGFPLFPLFPSLFSPFLCLSDQYSDLLE